MLHTSKSNQVILEIKLNKITVRLTDTAQREVVSWVGLDRINLISDSKHCKNHAEKKGKNIYI